MESIIVTMLPDETLEAFHTRLRRDYQLQRGDTIEILCRGERWDEALITKGATMDEMPVSVTLILGNQALNCQMRPAVLAQLQKDVSLTAMRLTNHEPIGIYEAELVNGGRVCLQLRTDMIAAVIRPAASAIPSDN